VAERVELFEVTVLAGIAPGLYSVETNFPQGEVTAVDVRIPSGHAGKTGIQVWSGTAQVLPRTSGAWFRGNKTRQRVEVVDPFPGVSAWIVYAYNLGKRPHTFPVRFELNELAAPVTDTLPPVLLLRQYGEAAL
jgi:hypothetical protein